MEPTILTEDNLDSFVNALNGNNEVPNSNLLNLKTVNTSGPEWDIPIGNAPNNVIPENLKPKRKGGKSRRRRRHSTKRRSNRRRSYRR